MANLLTPSDTDVDSQAVDQFRRPRRRRTLPELVRVALICLCIVGASVAAAMFVVDSEPASWGARADIVYVASAGVSDDVRERVLVTQAELIKSRAVLDEVGLRSGTSYGDLAARVTVDTGVNDILTITVRDRDPQNARLAAAAVVQAYLELTRRVSMEPEGGRDLIEREIAEINKRLPTASPVERDVLRDRLGRLQDRLLDLQVEEMTRPRTRLLSPPYVLDEPLSPGRAQSVVVGFVIGLVLAAAAAALLTRHARRRTLA